MSYVTNGTGCRFISLAHPFLLHTLPNRLGLCVALRVGDILLFNPSEYHCVSPLSVDRQIFSYVAYVKTAVVGGNDNSNELNEKEKEINEDRMRRLVQD